MSQRKHGAIRGLLNRAGRVLVQSVIDSLPVIAFSVLVPSLSTGDWTLQTIWRTTAIATAVLVPTVLALRTFLPMFHRSHIGQRFYQALARSSRKARR